VKAQLLTTLCGPLQCSHIFIGDHVLVAILSLYVVHMYTVQPNGEKESRVSQTFKFKQIFKWY